MLTFNDIEKLISRVTYKPNVKLEVIHQDWDFESYLPYPEPQILIRAVMWTLDSRREYPPVDEYAYIKIQQTAVVPWVVLEDGEEMFWTWLERNIFASLERHEQREWFRVDGKLHDDPHRGGW